ncbi:hypothetical protein EDD85DRAFT_806498 [Armillaria nabsnona]|nr:hypothetical protein EDD85DRAFT_806498 [Armillaria nabsnona]
MSTVVLARIARPLRTSCTRCLSGINVPFDIKRLADAHERNVTRLQASYENKVDELWKELESLRDAKLKRELREKQKRWERTRERERERQRKRQQEQEQEQIREQEEFTRSLTEVQLTNDKIQLLHKVAWLGENVSAASSLGIIDAIYRKRLEDALGPLPSGPQSVLSAIINGALDEPSHTYAFSRQKAISLLDPTLQKDEVDEAGHHLYHVCLDHVPIQPYRQPIDLREGQLSLPSVAVFFALAHWSQVDISVDYFSKDGKVAASIEGCFSGN